MLAIIGNNLQNSDIDFVIKDEDKEVYLFRMDWNGEVYGNGCTYNEDKGIYENIGKEYEPVYDECFGEYEIVGFIRH